MLGDLIRLPLLVMRTSEKDALGRRVISCNEISLTIYIAADTLQFGHTTPCSKRSYQFLIFSGAIVNMNRKF